MRAVKIILWILAILVLLAAMAAGTASALLRYKYPKVSPADQSLRIEITPERVARGEYLANHVMDCFGCHGQKAMDAYTYPHDLTKLGVGGFRIPRAWKIFPGDLTTPNITPYALGTWSDGEILRALTAGVGRDGNVLFPMMPYQAYGKMDREDMYSIVAYLRTLPAVAVDQPRTKIDFPLNLILRTLPADPQFKPRPYASDAVGTGRYLADAAGCMMCHTVVDKQEKPIGPLFAGGRVFDFPPVRGVIRSANITPDTLTGIGGWSRGTFIDIIRTRGARAAAVTRLGPEEPNTLMPYANLANMTDEDLGALYAYLRTLPAVSNSVVKWELKPN
jgi:mono/diheme cytochrome c family protein